VNQKVSVCIATYNGEKFIYQQIKSILPQLLENDEIIISDDSSTDNTLDVIRKFKDKRIKIYDNNCFKSPIFNFENALLKAKGDLIFLADQDDIWMDNRIEIQKNYLKTFDMVVCDAILIDENENILKNSFFKLNNSGSDLLKNFIKNGYLGCCMSFNKKILDKSLLFPAKIPMHDMWMGLISEIYGKTFFCEEKLVKYRRHNNNFSTTSGKGFSLMKKISYRFKLFYLLFCRFLRVK